MSVFLPERRSEIRIITYKYSSFKIRFVKNINKLRRWSGSSQENEKNAITGIIWCLWRLYGPYPYDFAKQNNQRKFWWWKRKFIHPLATGLEELPNSHFHFEWTCFSMNILDDRTPQGRRQPKWMRGTNIIKVGVSGKSTFLVPSNGICTPSAERRVTLRTAHFRKFKSAVWKTLWSVIKIRYILYEYTYPRLIFTNQNEPYG